MWIANYLAVVAFALLMQVSGDSGLWCQLIGWSERVALYDVAERTSCVFDRVFAC